ncbi:TonB-dependent receptor [Pedobacter sp. SYSU D00535]|uniref:TonB-dependent receptor n=1 Tax=Pedobacter sp. SYSU D00535 TaxID=2810308 RepID=UPI001A9643AA|nr:TonB-dependent receptor [Pedobacter sp. SYSU D00535]
MNFKYISLAIFSIALAGTAQSQTQPDEKKPEQQPSGSLTEEIEVVRAYKPVLADAAKIRRSPDLTNYKPFKPTLSYAILDNKLELNSDITQLQAQPVQEASFEVLRNNYAKVGVGNLGTNLGEFYINTGQDQALQAGVFFKHLGQEGNLNKQNISRQQIGLFGKSILEKITLNGDIGFERFATHFYGVNPEQPLFNTNPERQRFSTFSARGELLKNYQKDNNLDFAVKADAYRFANRFDGRESSFALSGFFNNVWRQFNIGLNSSLDFTGVKDSSYSVGNHIFRANPYIKFQGKNYRVALGLNFVQEFGFDPRTTILPALTAEVPIVPDFATIFAGLVGDVKKASFRDFANENPFLASNITIRNAVEKANFYGGIKGNGGSGFGFKAMVFLKRVENLPLYAANPNTPQKFDIIYDPGNSTIAGLEGELSFKASETLTWTGKVQMNKYKMATEDAAWLRPGFRLTSNARLAFSDRFNIDGEIVLNGDTQALTYISPAEQRVVTVKSFVDLSAGAEYMLKNRIGIFTRINNLFGSQYQRYLYYPNYGFNIFGGLNYSF